MSQRINLIDALEPRRLFAVLTPAETVSASITTVGQFKEWTLPLVAGRAVAIAAGDTGTTNFAPALSLIDPSGKTVSTSSGDKGAFISTTSLVTGTYKVRMKDVGNDQKGTARLTAFYYAPTITDSDDAFTAESGRRRASTIQPGDLDVWTINASSSQFLSALVAENKSGDAIGVGLQIVGPDGKLIKNTTNDKGAKIDVQGSKSGKYYVIVYEPGQDATGRYGITFAQTSAPQYTGDPDTATALAKDELRNGDLPAGDYDIFSINMMAGQTISATLSRTTGSLDPELLLIDSTGKIIASNNGSPGVTLTATVPSKGTYYLLLRDREADDGGQYSIRYTFA